MFPGEFTCRSGHCIDILKRCDYRKDCEDGSDEEHCSMIRIPEFYDKSLPPKNLHNEDIPNQILTRVIIEKIDYVNTLDMAVGLTIKLRLSWKDYHLKFENILGQSDQQNHVKLISKEDQEKVWTPLDKIVHESAVLDEIYHEKFFTLKVDIKEEPEKMDPSEPRETLLYPGSKNLLVLKQRIKIKYHCELFQANFPFDQFSCEFPMSMVRKDNSSLVLEQDKVPISLIGSTTLNEFEVKDIESFTKTDDKTSSFIFKIQFQRLYFHHLMTTFLQSFLLWLLAYLTLFLSIDDFANRFMGSVTLLLVLVALFSSLLAEVPKVYLFKFS